MDKSKLISFDEYQKTRHAAPYMFIHTSGDQSIYYFGSKHSYDPTDPQFDQIEKFWHEFLKATIEKKRIVFEEGGIRPFIDDRRKIIEKHADPGFLTYLATKADIELFTPEPSERFVMNEMAKHFTLENIFYYHIARMTFQWNCMIIKPNFELYMQGTLDSFKRRTGWSDIEATVANAERIHKQLFGTEFNKNDKQFFNNIINPTTPENSIVNKISRFEDDEFRELYLLSQFEKYWNEGYSIFVVYGFSHAYRQEPVLKTLK